MFLDVIRATIANNGYEVITCGVASAFFAQVIKFILFTVEELISRFFQQQEECLVLTLLE